MIWQKHLTSSNLLINKNMPYSIKTVVDFAGETVHTCGNLVFAGSASVSSPTKANYRGL